jgi:hypothetical protein
MFIKIHRKEGSATWDLTVDDRFIMSSMEFDRVANRAVWQIASDGEDVATVDFQVIDDESLTKRLARKNREILGKPILGA